jgi:hypothetical protein
VADAQRLHRSRAELSKIFLLVEAEALKELKDRASFTGVAWARL